LPTTLCQEWTLPVRVLQNISGALALVILVISWIVAIGVMALMTYIGIASLIDGQTLKGIVVIILSGPATMLTQTVIGIVAIPFGALAESGE
jgi:hypothetical protein